MIVPVQTVSLVDWVVVALTLAVAAVSVVGALYTVPWRGFMQRKQGCGAADTTGGFNTLWSTRAALQLLGAGYALSLCLRLQVLWSQVSVMQLGGYDMDTLCRLYIGAAAGVLEPAFLLTVLFACSYTRVAGGRRTGGVAGSARIRGRSPEYPNLFILALTFGLTLPMVAAQVVAALFSRIITQLQYSQDLMQIFFSASTIVPEMCPGKTPLPANCAACVWPEFSTLISAAFLLLYLGVLWHSLGRMAGAAVNRRLAVRIRVLQAAVSVLFTLSVAVRGVTVLFYPYDVGFVTLALANAVLICALILVVTIVLVWLPVNDTRQAARCMGGRLSDAAAQHEPELMPLVSQG